MTRDGFFQNLWIQGGPRMRVFFGHKPSAAPALNKIPLVRWRRGYVYRNGAHELLPRRLNLTYSRGGGSVTSGVLLHAKFHLLARSVTHRNTERTRVQFAYVRDMIAKREAMEAIVARNRIPRMRTGALSGRATSPSGC